MWRGIVVTALILCILGVWGDPFTPLPPQFILQNETQGWKINMPSYNATGVYYVERVSDSSVRNWQTITSDLIDYEFYGVTFASNNSYLQAVVSPNGTCDVFDEVLLCDGWTLDTQQTSFFINCTIHRINTNISGWFWMQFFFSSNQPLALLSLTSVDDSAPVYFDMYFENALQPPWPSPLCGF